MAAVTVLAVVLTAALAFLYWKTDIGEFRKQIQIASHLRELKDIDTRWEIELLRMAIAFLGGKSTTGECRLSTGIAPLSWSTQAVS